MLADAKKFMDIVNMKIENAGQRKICPAFSAYVKTIRRWRKKIFAPLCPSLFIRYAALAYATSTEDVNSGWKLHGRESKHAIPEERKEEKEEEKTSFGFL